MTPFNKIRKRLFLKKKNNQNTRNDITVVEVMLNNLVDKDIQSLLLPLNFATNIILCPKYRIKDNFITPNQFVYTITAILVACAVASFFIYRLYILVNVMRIVTIVYFELIFDVCFYVIGFIFTFILNVIQSNRNINFILTYQDVHRYLKMGGSMKRFVFWSWMTIYTSSFCYCIMILYFVFVQHFPHYLWINTIISSFYDSNIWNAIVFVQILNVMLGKWKNNLDHGLYGVDEVNVGNMSQAFVNILNCYNEYVRLFRNVILYYVVDMIAHGLLFIEMVLEMFKISNNFVSIPTKPCLYEKKTYYNYKNIRPIPKIAEIVKLLEQLYIKI
ncbi:uncharacterized protein LOC113494146 [Trichoplusia ni]|uniref:Uncharacterized protein LOC113494146 n=1 Tax=Trichoplusia ni TaxID=7111 RepID=A0A7E5VIW3_TRINI|nr:uncharacterized protein LOC113494146 [Trichoplusia ni]